LRDPHFQSMMRRSSLTMRIAVIADPREEIRLVR